MVVEEIIDELEQVKHYLDRHEASIVAMKNGQIIGSENGKGLSSFLKLIDEHKEDLLDCIIGVRILGKAFGFLCRYVNAKAVYATKGTKKAIATLIVGGIQSQVSNIVEPVYVSTHDEICPYEKLMDKINDPVEAYSMLCESFISTE